MNETKQPRPESSRELGQWLRSLSAVADPETRRRLNLAAERLERIDPLLAGMNRDIVRFLNATAGSFTEACAANAPHAALSLARMLADRKAGENAETILVRHLDSLNATRPLPTSRDTGEGEEGSTPG